VTSFLYGVVFYFCLLECTLLSCRPGPFFGKKIVIPGETYYFIVSVLLVLGYSNFKQAAIFQLFTLHPVLQIQDDFIPDPADFHFGYRITDPNKYKKGYADFKNLFFIS
jgi:hypothetical protein